MKKKTFTPAQKQYHEKLRDPRWQRRKTEIMQAALFRCEDCTSDKKTLNVHHCYYLKGKEPWEHPDALLICVCEECHKIRQKVETDIHINIAFMIREKPLAELVKQPAYAYFEGESHVR